MRMKRIKFLFQHMKSDHFIDLVLAELTRNDRFCFKYHFLTDFIIMFKSAQCLLSPIQLNGGGRNKILSNFLFTNIL